MEWSEPYDLAPGDSAELSALFLESRADYRAHFIPFSFDPASLAERLRLPRKDRYWGLRADGQLVGFFMLRGWDEGYLWPAFGVFISEEYTGRGLATFALKYALAWCVVARSPGVRLKVHPENLRARAVYEQAGFQCSGICGRTGHQMMELSLSLGQLTLDPSPEQ